MLQELKYACYPTGGHYRRHLDAFNNGERERLYSFILYLNRNWQPSVGGKLRVHEDDGTHFDIAPTAGTLVVFRSPSVAHEVLHTSSKRMAIVGWLGRKTPALVTNDDEVEEAAAEQGDSELRLALLRHFQDRGETIKF